MSDSTQTDPADDTTNPAVDPTMPTDPTPPQIIATQDPATPMGDPGEPVVNDAPVPRTATVTAQGAAGELVGMHDSMHTLTNHVENGDKSAAHAFIANFMRKIMSLVEGLEGKSEAGPAPSRTDTTET